MIIEYPVYVSNTHAASSNSLGSCLPDEIYKRIFICLSLNDVWTGTKVCRHWKQILTDKAFWDLKGYETVTESPCEMTKIAFAMLDTAVEKGLEAKKTNQNKMPLSALQFICGSNPMAQGLMVFGKGVRRITLKNASDLPENVDVLKLIRLDKGADLYKGDSKSTFISDLSDCKIFFGKGINQAELLYSLIIC